MEEAKKEKPYSSFGDLLAITKDPDLLAMRDSGHNGNQHNGPNGDQITLDQAGRSFVTAETLKQLDEEQKLDVAMLEHGGDMQRRLDLCGFPRSADYRQRFMNLDFESQHQKAFDAINDRKWVFVHGPRGTGKTSLACHLGWKHLELKPTHKAKFISIIRWLDSLRPNTEGEEVVPLPYLPPFIILDDFEKFQNTDWQKLRIFDLVGHLYSLADKYHVVITSNKSLKEIDRQFENCTRIGPALERIFEKSVQLPLTGPSKRRSPEIE